MNRRQREVPTLEDALAKGFAAMQGEEEYEPKTKPVAKQEPDAVNISPSPTETDYRPPTQAAERRTTFSVTPSTKPLKEGEAAQDKVSDTVEVLEKPSSTIGDDFDVEWSYLMQALISKYPNECSCKSHAALFGSSFSFLERSY